MRFTEPLNLKWNCVNYNDSIADSGKTEERSIDENKHGVADVKKRDFQKHVEKAKSQQPISLLINLEQQQNEEQAHSV